MIGHMWAIMGRVRLKDAKSAWQNRLQHPLRPDSCGFSTSWGKGSLSTCLNSYVQQRHDTPSADARDCLWASHIKMLTHSHLPWVIFHFDSCLQKAPLNFIQSERYGREITQYDFFLHVSTPSRVIHNMNIRDKRHWVWPHAPRTL